MDIITRLVPTTTTTVLTHTISTIMGPGHTMAIIMEPVRIMAITTGLTGTPTMIIRLLHTITITTTTGRVDTISQQALTSPQDLSQRRRLFVLSSYPRSRNQPSACRTTKRLQSITVSKKALIDWRAGITDPSRLQLMKARM